MHWTELATPDGSHVALDTTLWDAANQLWSNAALKPSEYSPTVLGLIFLKGAQASRLFPPRQTAKMAVPRNLEPYHGRIHDPACGSRGSFIQSARFVEAHQKNPTSEISVHGQDQWAWGTHLRRAQRARRVRQRRKLPNQRVTDTARPARLNLAVHGLTGEWEVAEWALPIG